MILLASIFTALLHAIHLANVTTGCDGSQADCQAKANSANDGDTITVPAGTFTWSQKVTITKAVTLQGAGIGTTIVKDGVQNPNQLLDIQLVAGKVSRVTGIEFQNGGRSPSASDPQGCIRFYGTGAASDDGSRLRFDHNRWNQLNGPLVCETAIGVIDHNDFIIITPCIYPDATRYNADPYARGDLNYSAPTNFGSEQFLFIEDNTISEPTSISNQFLTKGITDVLGGGKWVVRHNTFTNTTVQTHGTETRWRGMRAEEIYLNNFNFSFQTNLGGVRGGVCIMWGNTSNIQTAMSLEFYRAAENFYPWGAADGHNQWDINDPTIYYTGTTTGSGNLTVTDSNANWTPHQWAYPGTQGYTIRDVTDPHSNGAYGAMIVDNTATTITFKGPANTPISIPAGHVYEIRHVIQAMDQPCVARGSVITGTPVNPPPAGWNDQVIEGCYEWNNTNIGWGLNTYLTKDGVYSFHNIPMPGYTPYTYPHPLVSSPSPTPTATATPTATSTPSPTSTPLPTPTSTPTPSASPTQTPTPSSTPTATSTSTPTPSPTNTPTATPIQTPTATATASFTPTPRPSPSPTPTVRPTPTPTIAPTVVPRQIILHMGDQLTIKVQP